MVKPKETKNKLEKDKKDFIDYLIVVAVIQVITSSIKVGIETFINFLVILEMLFLIMSAFSFYFYLFNKDKKALQYIPILFGISLLFRVLEQIGIRDYTISGFFYEYWKFVIIYFVMGIFFYLLVSFIMWIYKKAKYYVLYLRKRHNL